MNRDIRKMLAAFLLCTLSFFAAQAADVPGKPENAVATANRTDGIRLTWNAVEGASYYIVYRYGGQTSQTGLVQTKVTTSSYLDTSCEAGVNIPYRVRAFNSSGVGGAYSAYVRGYRKVLLEPYVGGNVSVNPLANGGIAQSLKVRCNVDWTAKASDWINLNSGSFERSNDATELGFSLEPNETGAMREGTITVYAGQESATLKVVQGAVSVPDYDTWCGDSAHAIIEDAAFPEKFVFRPEYTGGFVSYPDETATGGSCLRSTPLDINGCAVISWAMPSAWKLRFRWRKDTSKTADALCLYAGNFDSSGTPNLTSATLLATCSSTEWAYTEVSSQSAPGATALFFVYEKKSGGTSGTASGFGFIDDFLLMTAPRQISFSRPTHVVNNAFTLNLPCDAQLTIATGVTFSHDLTLDGTTSRAKGYVYPTWRKLTTDDTLLSFAPGSGEDEKNTVFSSQRTSVPRTVVMEATYEVAGVSVSEQLTITITPPQMGAIDLSSSEAEIVGVSDWSWQSDSSARNGSCMTCPIPSYTDARTFTIRFDGTKPTDGSQRNFFSFDYKLQTLGSGEHAFCSVDGSPEMELPVTGDDAWHRFSIFIPDTTFAHDVTWRFVKVGAGAAGSGLSIDNVRIEKMPTSYLLDNSAQTVRFADYCVSEGSCSLRVDKGAEWLSRSAASGMGGKSPYQLTTPLAFSVAANETGSLRSGKLAVRTRKGPVNLYIVQSATSDTTVTDGYVRPSESYSGYYANVEQGTQTVFTASFKLCGQPVDDFTDVEWVHSFGNDATLEEGVLTVNPAESVKSGTIGFNLGDYWCRLSVEAHPPLSLVVPQGLQITSDGWWVEQNAEDGLYLQTELWGAMGAEKTLTATVTGPGIFRCEGRGRHTTAFYLDGERHGGVGGANWTERSIEVPEGEHVITLTYTKQNYAGVYDDISAIRNITWSPVTFYGFTLQGPSTVMGGEKVTFSLFKMYREASTGYVMQVPEPVGSIDDVSVSTGNSRTRDLLGLELPRQNEINVKVPLSVQWSDQVLLSVDVSMGGMIGIQPIAVFDVTPTTISGIVDCSIQEMSLPGDGDFAEALSRVDDTAVGGTCLRMTSRSRGSPSTLEVKVLDPGTLTFNYKLRALYNDPDYPAVLKIYVDGVEQSVKYATAEWTSASVDVVGAGPHVVGLKFTPANVRPEESWCDIDNMVWTPSGDVSSIISEAVVTGPASAEEMETLLYSLTLDGDVWSRDGGGSLSPTNWTVKADEWVLQCISGDPNALRINATYDTCKIKVSEAVAESSVFRVVGRYSIAGVTYQGTINVSVPPRTTLDAAIFDSGTYDNCYCYWVDGWYGSFADHSVGTSCAQSAHLDAYDTAYLRLELWGKGTLEFDWKVSCADDAYLEFTKVTQGRPVASITGEGQGWQHVTIVYGDNEDCDENGKPIRHQCTWSYYNGSGASDRANCGWVDNITWSGTTRSPIREAKINLKESLVPGETAPMTFTFYRWDQNYDRVPATDADLPTIESVSLYSVSDPALRDFISFDKDGSGNYTVTVSSACNVTGTFSVEAKYWLYGYEEEAYVWGVSVEEGSLGSASLLSARSPQMMSANGINTVAECQLAGLDPEDPDAKLAVSVTVLNGVPHITWSPNLPDRTYIIKGKASLADPQWVVVGKVPLGDTEWVAPADSTYRFFKVEIESNK